MHVLPTLGAWRTTFKNIRKPNGRVYPMWYESQWNPLKKKSRPRYVMPATRGLDTLVGGVFGFGLRCLFQGVPWHDHEKIVTNIRSPQSKWDNTRSRMTDDQWARHMERQRYVFNHVPSHEIAQEHARRDLPDLLDRMREEERKEEEFMDLMREVRATTRAEEQPEETPTPTGIMPEQRAEADYMALREENQAQLSGYWTTVEAQNERDRKGNEEYLAEKAKAASVETSSAPEQPAEPSMEADQDDAQPQGSPAETEPDAAPEADAAEPSQPDGQSDGDAGETGAGL